MRCWGLILVLALLALAAHSQAHAHAGKHRGRARPPVVDAHTHLSARVWPYLQHMMKENGLAAMVNFSGGSTRQSFTRNKRMSDSLEGRVVHLFNPDWYGIDDPAWAHEQAEMLRVAVTEYGYRGMKISKALGLGARFESGVLVSVDDELLDPLWETAGLLGVPVTIHTGDPKAFWEPTNIENERYAELSLNPRWSYHERWRDGEVDSWPELVEAFYEVVRRHRETDFVGVHFGNAPEDPWLVKRMLDEHPNLYVDIAARVGEIGRQPAGRLRALFIAHKERILFGTDIGIYPGGLMLGAPGPEPAQLKDIKPFYDLTFRWLETPDSPMPHPVPIQGDWMVNGVDLPHDVLDLLYSENARRLFKLGDVGR
jgi:hypothetical protein